MTILETVVLACDVVIIIIITGILINRFLTRTFNEAEKQVMNMEEPPL